MIYDDSLSEFVPGGSGSRLTTKFAPPGLPSMSTVLADPISSPGKMKGHVRRWRRTRIPNAMTTVWSATDADVEMGGGISIFQGEESLVPESIPDDLWQTHFRQHDAELNDRKETEYLLQLYKQTSGRWPVIYDRWQMHPVYGLRGKSVESLKSKFNKVAIRLIEIDLLQRKRPATTIERIQFSQQLKYLPIFAMKFNEKNEFLRRLFLENSFKRPSTSDQDKMMNEIMRIPSLAMKKRQQGKPPVTPGPHLASSLIQTVHNDISNSEYNRVKAALKGLGADKSNLTMTPKVARLVAVVEREAAALLMMRDSLQRKRQELEILRTSGGNASSGVRMRQSGPAPVPPAPAVPVNLAAPPQSITISQQKRKR